MERISAGFVLGGFLAAGLVVGGEARAQFERLDVSKENFAQQAAKIRQDLAAPDVYSELAPADRETVLQLLERMDRSFGDAPSAASLSPTAKTDLFNDQERINTLLSQAAEDSRVVCRRERPTGTRRSITSCTTVAEMRRSREEAIDNLRRLPRAPENSDGRGPLD